MNKEIQVEATLTAVGEPVAIGMSKAARAGMSDAEWREAPVLTVLTGVGLS